MKPTQAPANAFVRSARRIYHPLGFSKGYNALLCLIFVGALMGFSLARLQYLSFNGVYCSSNGNSAASHAAPGECYWYRTYRRNYVGIILHLATILPAGLLVCFQFIPAIRHKAITYHRAAGYIILLLALLSNASVLMIANHAFGGDNAVRFLVGALTLAFTGALALAYYNIKRLQIDQHRAWMIRAWGWAGSIIALRLIMFIAAKVQAAWGGEAITYVSFSCDELLSMLTDESSLFRLYPACRPENQMMFAPNGQVAVQANFNGGTSPSIAASLHTYFGPAAWLAWLLHIFVIELYLTLTPAETERLRRVSYERQLKAGFKNAGSAGLTVDRLGDSEPWLPPLKETAASPAELSTVDRKHASVEKSENESQV